MSQQPFAPPGGFAPPPIPGQQPQQQQPQAAPAWPAPPQQQAPQGYPGPAVPMPAQQPPQQAPQGYAPAPGGYPPAPAVNMAHLGAAIAGATLGVARLPRLLVGDYLLEIELTKKPERSIALLVEFTIVSSTNPERPAGMRVSWYQDLSGATPNAQAAQQAAVLAFVLRACGFNAVDDATAAGWSQQALAQQINACFTEPGPLVKRRIRCSVVDSGKRSQKSGAVLCDHNWSPA